MLSSRCASYVFGMWWCTSLHIPHPPPFTMCTCDYLLPDVLGRGVLDPACITIRDYVLHCAGLHIRYARVTVGSHVLSLSHISKPSKSMHCPWAGFTEVAGRSHAYASSLQSAAGLTRAIQHNMVVLSIVSYISTD